MQDGDLFDMGGLVLAFLPANEEELHAQAQRRTKPGRFISPGVTLFLLTLFQATLCFKLLRSYQGKADAPPILPCFWGAGRLHVVFISAVPHLKAAGV